MKGMTPETRIKIGTGLCVLGLAVALVSLFMTRPGEFPIMLFVGAFIYLPGSFLAFLSAQGKERNKVFWSLRFIRLAFFGAVAFAIFRMMNP